MLRTFPEHRIRPVHSLDGLWDFLPVDTEAGKSKPPKDYPRHIEVPSAWESLPDLRGYRGTAWFRHNLHATDGKNLRLVFGGVSHTGSVFVNGKPVGGHYDAFTPWDVVVSGLKAGEHELAVKVDNSFGEHSALHIPNDYYTYGGITRPVEVQEVPDLFIDKLFAVPKLGKAGWRLELRVRVRNVGRKALTGRVRVMVAGVAAEWDLSEVAAGSSAEVCGILKNPDVSAWTAETPHLYFLEVHLLQNGVAVDDKIDRVGFRETKVRGKKLLLNGGEIFLRGFNRHEDHPMYGCAVPSVAMAQDLAVFEDLHCNFLRTSHYPNDQRLLDMCDERGLYVWEESHSRQTPFKVPMFDAQIRQSSIEMVENHFNHPCILMWGSLNECDTVSDEGDEVHSEVLKLLRSLDASRPITYAGHLRQRDRCLKHADIVSWNLYTGWYGGAPEKTLAEVEEMIDWMDSPESDGGAGKPLIISEFGAGAIPGLRNPQADPWSEEFQAIVLDEALRVYLRHPRIMGAAIWQFCDVRVTPEGNPLNGFSPLGRPRCMNNKGVVDEYRRPKLAYATVKHHMQKAKKLRGG